MAQTVYALNLNEGPNFGKLVSLETTGVAALFRDGPTDLLYAAIGTAAHALFSGTARQDGTWAKRIVTEKYETYGWLEVQSNFTDANGTTAVTALVTITDAAGTLLSSTTVADRTPVRLAPFCENELIVTVVSKARITAVKIASSNEELKQV